MKLRDIYGYAFTAVIVVSVTSYASAGPNTYSRCTAAASLSPTFSGSPGPAASQAWRSFCNSVPSTSPYKGSCFSYYPASRVEKNNYCFNFTCDPTTSALPNNASLEQSASQQCTSH